jgi:thioredoxin reductase (NADPH)
VRGEQDRQASDAEHVPVLIVGGGPAGYTAALYAARAGLRPVCVEGYESGGQIARTTELANYPGFPDAVGGQELADRIREQAVNVGARIVFEDVTEVDLGDRPFRVETTGPSFSAQALVVATGSRPKKLGLPGEDELTGRGVAFCAICDGPMFAGRRVVVVGGGDAAIEEALALRLIASEVVLVHRRNEFRAVAASRLALAAANEIQVRTPVVVEEIVGDNVLGLTGVRLRDVETGGTEYLEADGLFIAIGQQPASGLFTPGLDVDQNGFLRTRPGTTVTNLPGVFAAGDVADPRYRQAVTAAAQGCMAAIDAERWLSGAGAIETFTGPAAGIPAARSATGTAPGTAAPFTSGRM